MFENPTAQVLELDRPGSEWQRLVSMEFPRHMPGVGVLQGTIVVCGGSDDSWTAQAQTDPYCRKGGVVGRGGGDTGAKYS